MSVEVQQGREPRASFQRNRAALLEGAQRHFMRDGVGASLERVAEQAGVGTGTHCRYFPTREALPAAVPRTRSAEPVAHRADIAQLDDASERLRQWLRAMEKYFSAFSGLPEQFVAAARSQEPRHDRGVRAGRTAYGTRTPLSEELKPVPRGRLSGLNRGRRCP